MKFITVMLLIVVLAGVNAQSAQRVDSCTDVYYKSRIIMEARQKGFHPREVFDPNQSTLYNAIAGMAYRLPLFQNPENQEKIARLFAETQYKKCVKLRSV
jgi:hypothetical protein